MRWTERNNPQAKVIIEQQMAMLFRGSNSPVTVRHLADTGRQKLISLNIDLVESYLPFQDKAGKRRAAQTIANLKGQLNG